MVEILRAAHRFFAMNARTRGTLPAGHPGPFEASAKLRRNHADAIHVDGDNPSCGDEIHLAVQFGGDGKVEEIKFTGQGCAISQASASLMTLKLKGKSREEAGEMLGAFHDLVTNEVRGSAEDAGRSAADARRAQISAAGEVRHARLARLRAGERVFRPWAFRNSGQHGAA